MPEPLQCLKWAFPSPWGKVRTAHPHEWQAQVECSWRGGGEDSQYPFLHQGITFPLKCTERNFVSSELWQILYFYSSAASPNPHHIKRYDENKHLAGKCHTIWWIICQRKSLFRFLFVTDERSDEGWPRNNYDVFRCQTVWDRWRSPLMNTLRGTVFMSLWSGRQFSGVESGCDGGPSPDISYAFVFSPFVVTVAWQHKAAEPKPDGKCISSRLMRKVRLWK